jgi:tetratricopeptide (TPR) repeat protein
MSISEITPKRWKWVIKPSPLQGEHDLEEYTGWALNHFGLIYTNLKNYEKALWYYKAQEKANLNINNKPGMAYFYQDYGNVLIKLNQLDSAEYYTRKAESTLSSFLW